jgi:hypothetical protein
LDGLCSANIMNSLRFERKVDFHKLVGSIPGYSVKKVSGKAGMGVFFGERLVARCFKKHDFYEFLAELKVDWRQVLSQEPLPYDALFFLVRETLFIIEVKYQQVAEYVYRKLQTCDFKRKQYQKLVAPLGLKVEYVYVLNDWFKKPGYKDVLDYIHSVNCHYKFNELPLSWLGLPTRKV